MNFRGDLFHDGRLLLQNVSGRIHESGGRFGIALSDSALLPRDGNTYELRTADGAAFTILVKTILVGDFNAIVVFDVKPATQS